VTRDEFTSKALARGGRFGIMEGTDMYHRFDPC
jgi:hypothetical protein